VSSGTAALVRAELAALARPEKARVMAGFFKTGKGQYGEGDRFWGVTVPEQRKVARAWRALSLPEIRKLLDSPMHEERLTALLILVHQYERGAPEEKQRVFDFYLKNLARVNNWDLVDSSAHQIVGQHLLQRDRALLYRLAKSKLLWERRVAMVSTYAFIGAGEHEDTFALARVLLRDEEDLMHKAVGWMLREVGKRIDPGLLRGFLRANAKLLPRTALRYSIEHFDQAERKAWMAR
jgi:3-methyladenine DNA glycosylase AlkD